MRLAGFNQPPSSPSCTNPTFTTGVQLSMINARNQVEKFKKRRLFLERRLAEARTLANDHLIDPRFPDGILRVATTKFSRFLNNFTDFTQIDSPSEELIFARQNLTDQIAPQMANFAIYAWQDGPTKPPRTLDPQYGYWHIVKVEVRLPRRCNDACGVDGTPDPAGKGDGWPFIRTFRKGFLGMTRCYELIATEGMVKARVTRYDENKDPGRMLFANGAPIWDIRFFHPDRGAANVNIWGACNRQADPQLLNLPATGTPTPWARAFMLNKPPGTGDVLYDTCWNEAAIALDHGTKSETCAQYYFGTASGNFGPEGMRLKFVPCDATFTSGGN